MNCPSCKETLVILELHEIEIDFCANCKGIWLDAGELELMLDDESEKAQLLQSLEIIDESNEKRIKCPICSKKMEKVRHKDVATIADKCIKNHGIWFDEGELEEIIRAASVTGDNRFTFLLKELFKKIKFSN